MNLFRKNTFAILGVAMLCAAGSSAMTLGRARGAVLLGQSLKLSVPVQLEADEGGSALCFEADVFYGDTRLDASRVAVSSERASQALSATVSVASAVPVDEPVVTVYVRAGCESKTTRRYVLLADLATEAVPVAKSNPEVREVSVRPVASLPQPPRTGPVATPTAKRVVREAPVAKPEGALTPVVQPAATVKAAVARRPHLKLLPLDIAEERDPVLKLSGELILGDGEDLQKRAEAAALWRALNASPQDILASDSRRQTMETDLKGLQVATAKNKQALRDLSSRLEQAESQRYANPLVYGLVLAVLVFSLGLAYALLRLRRGGLAASPWWTGKGPADARRDDSLDLGLRADERNTEAVRVMESAPVAPAVVQAQTGLTEVDIDLHLDEPDFNRTLASTPTREVLHSEPVTAVPLRSDGHVDFAHSMTTTTLRSVNTQEMLDVRQQAEFFMTLGQHDEAVGVLRDSIESSAESNPLVYLDLLRVLHTLGRKADFDHYRADFNMLFSGHVPAYSAFAHGGQGLEAYPDVCQRIGDLWPSHAAVDYMEQCLIRSQGDGSRGFDLDAFRDLLMLHGMAKRIASDTESGLMPFSAPRAGAEDGGLEYAGTPMDMPFASQDTQPVSSAGREDDPFAIDLDLSEHPGNLIDFDAADLLPHDRKLPSRKA